MKKKLIVVLIIALIFTVGLYFFNKSNNQYSELVSGGLKVVKTIHKATEDIRGGARVVSERGAISASDWKYINSYFDKHEVLFNTTEPEKHGYSQSEQEMFKFVFEKVYANYIFMCNSFAKGNSRMGASSMDTLYGDIEKANKGLYVVTILSKSKNK